MRSNNHLYPPCPRCGYEVIPGTQCAHCARQQRHAESTQRLRAGNEANRQEAERLRLERQMRPSSFPSSVPQQSYQQQPYQPQTYYQPQQTYRPSAGAGEGIGALIVLCLMGLAFLWPYIVAILSFLFVAALVIGGIAFVILIISAIFSGPNESQN